ncbi:rRNA maturation RNase YbeY [Aureicoccus marinus]|uniref:Endoribonuclease YbeY n=1 Tax=Aureicoccus marinus TaxID=754435 RepID=A0A2S7T9I9_9FLAO|nr:rRNA maturation RNase YbeY [Aureicoccus marinus]PQJ16251.1 rRNA maturation RNase YbeY [Aureicoccus marinus]
MIALHNVEDSGYKREDLEAWLERICESKGKAIQELNYVFCDDEYLYEMNMQYLNHDTYTDIITFDYSEGEAIHSDIFISVERVSDNASKFAVPFSKELLRVMAHGILHLVGLNDKTEAEKEIMRKEEEVLMSMFHVEQ